MTQEKFIEHIIEYQNRILKIASENWYAILLSVTVSSDNGSYTTSNTNMDNEWIAYASFQQTVYNGTLIQ